MIDIEKILFHMNMDVNAFFWYFYDYGLSILMVFIFVELLRLAFDWASGRPAQWDSKLATLLLIGVLGVNWNGVSHLFWNITMDVAKLIYGEFPSVSNIFTKTMGYAEDASGLSILLDTISKGPVGLVNAIVAAFASLFLIIIFIVIDVYIIATFFCYCLLLASGLGFFPFLLSSEFRNIAVQWFNNVFVFFFQIICLAIVLRFIGSLQDIGLCSYEKAREGLNSFYNIYQMLLLPLVAIGLILIIPRFVRSLIPAGGMSETTVLAPVMTGATFGFYGGLRGASMVRGRGGGK